MTVVNPSQNQMLAAVDAFQQSGGKYVGHVTAAEAEKKRKVLHMTDLTFDLMANVYYHQSRAQVEHYLQIDDAPLHPKLSRPFLEV